jgi:hypothetical protein
VRHLHRAHSAQAELQDSHVARGRGSDDELNRACSLQESREGAEAAAKDEATRYGDGKVANREMGFGTVIIRERWTNPKPLQLIWDRAAI